MMVSSQNYGKNMELTRREAQALNIQIEDAGKAQRRLNELKAKIKALGTVNVAAIEEYQRSIRTL